jgi:transposase-like protein
MSKLTDIERLFNGRHFDREVIVLCVRWYQKANASDAGLQEFSVRSHPVERHRACAYDRQGSNERQLH